MKDKIIGIGIAIAIIVSVMILTMQEENSLSDIAGKHLTPLPEGKHLQLSLNESVGIKSVS